MNYKPKKKRSVIVLNTLDDILRHSLKCDIECSVGVGAKVYSILVVHNSKDIHCYGKDLNDIGRSLDLIIRHLYIDQLYDLTSYYNHTLTLRERTVIGNRVVHENTKDIINMNQLELIYTNPLDYPDYE